MKAAALTVLTASFMLLAPAFAQALPPLPNPNPSPDQMCANTQQIVDTVRAQHPNATPDQIADNYDQMMGAKVPGYQLVQGQQHQQLLQLIRACGIH